MEAEDEGEDESKHGRLKEIRLEDAACSCTCMARNSRWLGALNKEFGSKKLTPLQESAALRSHY